MKLYGAMPRGISSPTNRKSMLDLLTLEEDKAAAEQGWGLYHVYELSMQKWVVRVMPTEAAPIVVAQAKSGSPLAIKALRLAVHGPERKT